METHSGVLAWRSPGTGEPGGLPSKRGRTESDIVTPWTAAHQAFLSITRSWSFLKLMSIESVMPSNHLILCRPLLLLPSIFPSIRVFSSESVLHIWWPKYWSFSISPSKEYSGLIFFRMDWLDLLAALAFPLDLGARPLCRRLRGRARILERVAISSSWGSSQLRD